jgi:hypothetical protein
MIKKDLYRYIGRNGIITSLVHLDDAKYYPMYRLIADEGKVLTDGEQVIKSIDIFAEDLGKWTEIEDGQI